MEDDATEGGVQPAALPLNLDLLPLLEFPLPVDQFSERDRVPDTELTGDVQFLVRAGLQVNSPVVTGNARRFDHARHLDLPLPVLPVRQPLVVSVGQHQLTGGHSRGRSVREVGGNRGSRVHDLTVVQPHADHVGPRAARTDALDGDAHVGPASAALVPNTILNGLEPAAVFAPEDTLHPIQLRPRLHHHLPLAGLHVFDEAGDRERFPPVLLVRIDDVVGVFLHQLSGEQGGRGRVLVSFGALECRPVRLSHQEDLAVAEDHEKSRGRRRRTGPHALPLHPNRLAQRRPGEVCLGLLVAVALNSDVLLAVEV